VSDFADDPQAELHDVGAAKDVSNAVDAITADLIRNAAKYPSAVRDLPKLVAAMEKAIKSQNLRDAAFHANLVEQQMEAYKPTEEPAQEAKLIVRRRVRVLSKVV
jgi:hypothetical protein